MTTLMERRAAKIAALQAKHAEDLQKVQALACVDEIKLYLRKGNWNRAALLTAELAKLIGPFDAGQSGG
jgi:hypothetical protein